MVRYHYLSGDLLHDRDFGLWGRIVEVEGERVRVRWQDGTSDWLIPDRKTKLFAAYEALLNDLTVN